KFTSESMTRKPDLFASCIPAVLCDCIFYKFGYLYKKFQASFESHLSHIQDVFKGHCHCHVIAMTFIEIQKIFEQLFITLPRKFKSA
ncbi:MAG: hypothetical protein KH221_03925, partial [Atopobium sp.]|nr:hypothetical protein [Atopobium sp.]